MNLKAFILLSLLTIFSFQTANAQLLDDEWGDTETLAVQEKLQSVTGRIIQVMRGKDFTAVLNVCSAILINENTIVSAAHCFKREPSLPNTDISDLEKLQIASHEFYFDIPGVTTKNLDFAIASISPKDSVKIFKEKENALNAILSDLPKIGEPQILKAYEENIPNQLTSYRPPHKSKETGEKGPIVNYWGNIYDTSVAILDRKITTTPISIGELNKDNDTIYVSGYYGGNLAESLRVFKCNRNRSVIDKLLPLTELDKFANLLKNSKQLIVSYCNGEILPGQSGGPQVQLKDGNIVLVGVTSATLIYQDAYAISPILSNVINEFTF
jgi:hypothetical protein